MGNLSRICLWCLLVASYCVMAQNTALREILPSGTDVKLVWQTGGYFYTGRNKPDGNKIQYMDSRNGVIVDIVSGGRFKYEPSFTYDGSRIVYGAVDGAYYVVSVPTAQPGEPRKLEGAFTGSCRVWRDNAGNDYVIATDARSTNKIAIVPLDPGKGTRKDITMPITAGNDGFCWMSITADGKYLGGGLPAIEDLGFIPLTSTFTAGAVTKANPNGCWGTIERTYTGSPRMLHQWGDHKVIRITAMGGSSVSITLSGSILSGGNMYSTARWSNNSQFITIAEGGGSDGERLNGCKGPWLVNISNTSVPRGAAVFANNSTESCEMDAFLYTTGTAAAVRPMRIARQASSPSLHFDITGRSAGARLRNSGVFVGSKRSHKGLVMRGVHSVQ